MSNNKKEEAKDKEPTVMGVQIDKRSREIIGDSDTSRSALLDYLLLSQS